MEQLKYGNCEEIDWYIYKNNDKIFNYKKIKKKY